MYIEAAMLCLEVYKVIPLKGLLVEAVLQAHKVDNFIGEQIEIALNLGMVEEALAYLASMPVITSAIKRKYPSVYINGVDRKLYYTLDPMRMPFRVDEVLTNIVKYLPLFPACEWAPPVIEAGYQRGSSRDREKQLIENRKKLFSTPEGTSDGDWYKGYGCQSNEEGPLGFAWTY